MTTIAWDGKTVAADTLTVCGFQRNGKPAQKLFPRTLSGKVYAMSGLFGWAAPWIAWHEAGADPALAPATPNQEQRGSFIVFDKGRCFYCATDFPYLVEAGAPDAWGTGQEYAIGAMRAGASAVQAVRIAADVDIHTGGDIQEIDLAVRFPTGFRS